MRTLRHSEQSAGTCRMAAVMATALLLALAPLAAPPIAALAQDQAQPTPTQPAEPAEKPTDATPQPSPAATEQPAPTAAPAESQPAEESEPRAFTLQGILYDDSSAFIFILVTVIMGGAAGYSTGKAIAQTWRPGWHLIASAIVLGIAVRFIHYALFGASFLTVHYYLIDTLFVLAATFAGFRLTRVKQMTTRYGWLYRPAGPFAWTVLDSGSKGASST
jgi:hypothetical protein